MIWLKSVTKKSDLYSQTFNLLPRTTALNNVATDDLCWLFKIRTEQNEQKYLQVGLSDRMDHQT